MGLLKLLKRKAKNKCRHYKEVGEPRPLNLINVIEFSPYKKQTLGYNIYECTECGKRVFGCVGLHTMGPITSRTIDQFIDHKISLEELTAFFDKNTHEIAWYKIPQENQKQNTPPTPLNDAHHGDLNQQDDSPDAVERGVFLSAEKRPDIHNADSNSQAIHNDDLQGAFTAVDRAMTYMAMVLEGEGLLQPAIDMGELTDPTHVIEQFRAAINPAPVDDDAMPCVSCDQPSETQTPDDAEMCWQCFGEFNAAEYSNLARKMTELIQRDYPGCDIQDALDPLRPLPVRASVGLDAYKPPILKGVGKIQGDGWKDVTKIGEVVYVWNDELPAPYKRGQYPRVGKEEWSASTDQYDFVPAIIEEIRAAITHAPVDIDALKAVVIVDSNIRHDAHNPTDAIKQTIDYLHQRGLIRCLSNSANFEHQDDLTVAGEQQ